MNESNNIVTVSIRFRDGNIDVHKCFADEEGRCLRIFPEKGVVIFDLVSGDRLIINKDAYQYIMIGNQKGDN